ncbi:MAG: YwaF family protein [Clostridiales bacterium]|nr:YwaF family protein [Clostridiales bacterium]
MGNGFEHFCPEHTCTLIVILISVISGCAVLKRTTDKMCDRTLMILAVLHLILELLQDILLIRDGGDLISFLPLHLCNLGIFVNLAAVSTKGRISSFFSEISVVLILPGSLGALLFPDWNYRPFWSYLPVLCFMTHAILVFIPVVFLIREKACISFRHFWYSYAFLAVTVPPVFWFDKRFDQNYIFLRYPVYSSPLELIYDLTGEKYYIAGLLILLTAALIVEYLLYAVSSRLLRTNRKRI